MPIETICPECLRTLRVPDELIGQNVKCPGCEATFIGIAAEPNRDAEPVDSIRESPGRPEPIREAEEPPSRPVPRLDEDDEYDDFDDEEDDDDFRERMEELRRRRQKRLRLERAKARVTPPAIGLMVVGGLNILASLGMVVFFAVLAYSIPGGGGPPGPGGIGVMGIQLAVFSVVALFLTVFGILIIYGGIRMKQLRAYGMAMTACVLAILSALGSCMFSLIGIIGFILGLTFAIWGFIVLGDSDVRASFHDRTR